MSLFSYRDALKTYLELRQLTEQLGETKLAGAVRLNLSSVYSQLGDLLAADQEANDAVELLENSKDPPKSWARLSCNWDRCT